MGTRFLCAVTVLAMLGCSHPSRVTHTAQTQGNPMVPRTTLVANPPPSAVPAQQTSANSQPVSPSTSSTTQANAESTPATPEVTAAAPTPTFGRSAEPVAEVLVNAMVGSLHDRQAGSDGITRIGISQLRNQSRTTREEYEAFNARLAEILTQASRDRNVVFVAGEAGPPVQYQVQGTAYLTTFEGFDLWELFISVSPADRNMTLWSANGPVYVMRLPRPGQPQMVVKVTK